MGIKKWKKPIYTFIGSKWRCSFIETKEKKKNTNIYNKNKSCNYTEQLMSIPNKGRWFFNGITSEKKRTIYQSLSWTMLKLIMYALISTLDKLHKIQVWSSEKFATQWVILIIGNTILSLLFLLYVSTT